MQFSYIVLISTVPIHQQTQCCNLIDFYVISLSNFAQTVSNSTVVLFSRDLGTNIAEYSI